MAILLLGGSFIQDRIGSLVFGIYKDIFVQYTSGVFHFLGDLTTCNDFVPCVLRANFFYGHVVLLQTKYSVCGLSRAHLTSGWLLSTWCNSTHGDQYLQSDPKPLTKRYLQVCQID